MSDIGETVPFLLRDRRIKAVEDKVQREPTANELRAIDALPLKKNLNDTSPNGQRIYYLLKAFEAHGHVEVLEEAGELLWGQIFAKPDSSQTPRLDPVGSIAKTLARRADAEVGNVASRKSKQVSPAGKPASTNATSNAFAGSPQKSWVEAGFSVPPSPRRASSSSTERSSYSNTTRFDSQSTTSPIPFCLTQPSQPNRSYTSAYVNRVSGAPTPYSLGVYTPWPHPTSRERQCASPYSIQVPASSMSPAPERVNPAKASMSRSGHNSNLGNDMTHYNPSTVLYDPARSYRFATFQNNGSDRSSPNSTPQVDPGVSTPGTHHGYYAQDPSRRPNHTAYPNRLTSSSRSVDGPSTPPFHPAISSPAQQPLLSRTAEEQEELARVTAKIHRSLASLPDDRENQQVASSSNTHQTHSSTMDAAITLSYMPNTGRRTQMPTPSPSTHRKSSPAVEGVACKPSSNNPFIIRGDLGFIRTFQPESGT
ncbi:hypothetical protein DSL72_009247 [Monilinia vaccinii-corymbosi]|uniref:Uncharacterized protein n=1 Tax=Monilinia vaccinii-corymbosi TaxID=61207 RepID=A0A8A3PQ69_9HELO|nr:hypothetical protein DSL72_009247 [Monilinia vaccinii-corymbosi]